MGALTKDRGFWPKMVQDFFGAEDHFHMNNKFWFTDKSVEVPSANVIESEKEFKLELSAPGFDKKDFKIEVEEGILNISAEKEMKMEEEKENYRKREFSYSSIHRAFALPENVKDEQIDAKYEKGILKIVLPKVKSVENKPKKAIEVG